MVQSVTTVKYKASTGLNVAVPLKRPLTRKINTTTNTYKNTPTKACRTIKGVDFEPGLGSKESAKVSLASVNNDGAE
jgi:hypothetical protein